MGYFKDNFIGKGTLKRIVEEFNKVTKSLNNINIKMPPSLGGVEPIASVTAGKITLDFSDVDFSAPLTKQDQAQKYFDDPTEIGGGTDSGGSGGLPSGGLAYQVLQKNAANTGTEWDYVRASNLVDTP